MRWDRCVLGLALCMILAGCGSGRKGYEQEAEEVVLDMVDGVRGLGLYDGPDEGRAMLMQQGFVVVPQYFKQIYGPYHNETGLPPFVTADSIHRSFHTLFEEGLIKLEHKHHGEMLGVTKALLSALGDDTEASPEARQLAEDFFWVGRCLLENTPAPAGRDRVAAEIERITDTGGVAPSALFTYELDYSQCKPRGFYTQPFALWCAIHWIGKSDPPKEAQRPRAG